MQLKERELEKIKLSILSQFNDTDSAIRYLMHPCICGQKDRRVFKIDEAEVWVDVVKVEGNIPQYQINFLNEHIRYQENTLLMANEMPAYQYIQERYALVNGKLFFYLHSFGIGSMGYEFYRTYEKLEYYVQFNLTDNEFIESGEPKEVLTKWLREQCNLQSNEKYLDMPRSEIRGLFENLKALKGKPDYINEKIDVVVEGLEAFLSNPRMRSLRDALVEIADKVEAVQHEQRRI